MKDCYCKGLICTAPPVLVLIYHTVYQQKLDNCKTLCFQSRTGNYIQMTVPEKNSLSSVKVATEDRELLTFKLWPISNCKILCRKIVFNQESVITSMRKILS